MSNRERIISLLDNVPDYKMGYILAYVQGITADEEADDAFCQRMIENYENDPDPERIRLTPLRNASGNGGLLDVSNCHQEESEKFIDRLPLNEKKRVVAAIERLPNGEDIKKLKGHADLLRLRVGEYRIIYTVDHGELIVMVIDADNRGQIYNRY